MIFGLIIRVGLRLLRKAGVNVPDITKLRRRRGLLDDVIDQMMGEEPQPRERQGPPLRQRTRIGRRRW